MRVLVVEDDVQLAAQLQAAIPIKPVSFFTADSFK